MQMVLAGFSRRVHLDGVVIERPGVGLAIPAIQGLAVPDPGEAGVVVVREGAARRGVAAPRQAVVGDDRGELVRRQAERRATDSGEFSGELNCHRAFGVRHRVRLGSKVGSTRGHREARANEFSAGIGGGLDESRSNSD